MSLSQEHGLDQPTRGMEIQSKGCCNSIYKLSIHASFNWGFWEPTMKKIMEIY